jgi:hypothetical protein
MHWSIGMLVGESPFRLSQAQNIINPVLTRHNVTDLRAAFVADPFMIRSSGVWHMLFEVMDQDEGKGVIGLAESHNGFQWRYRQVVLRETFHLSYPYVFKWKHVFYMIPETLGLESIWLYRADSFPTKWSRATCLTNGGYADPTLFRFKKHWWLLACTTPNDHGTLRLYQSKNLFKTFEEHPSSPIIYNNPGLARPAGRVTNFNNRLIRYAQNCIPYYGRAVRAFEIVELTQAHYREIEIPESPLLTRGSSGWNSSGMHHLDIHYAGDGLWMACVDGSRFA